MRIDPRYYRPAEVDVLQGDAGKAADRLGWKPKVSFEELVRIMVEADLELARREAHAQSYRSPAVAAAGGIGDGNG